jgi:hypothetical protein
MLRPDTGTTGLTRRMYGNAVTSQLLMSLYGTDGTTPASKAACEYGEEDESN